MARHAVMVLACCLAVAACPVAAQSTPAEDKAPFAAADLSFTELERAEGIAIVGHPNEVWRVRALRALKLGQPRRAAHEFQSGARYADKYSQHALSLMHWHGVGVERDRAVAYAWSDLAAERGYRDLLLVREKMWLQLGQAERERALRLGADLYVEYGDEVARPRLEWEMRKGRRAITGSRLGFEMDRVQFVQNRFDVDPRYVYARERWDPEQYWEAEDNVWNGKVLVLPAERVPAEPQTQAVDQE